MSLFSSKGGKPKTEHYIVLDLGTEMIKCLVFEKLEDRGHILGRSSVPHAAGSMRGGMVINIPEASAQIKTAITQAVKQAGASPQNLIISMPGDLVKSLITTVHYHRAQPESHIDASELKNIVYKVQHKAYEQMREALSHEQDQAERLDVRLINTTVIDTRVDGYRITNPLGFQGGTVSLSIFNVFAPLVHLGALQSIADHLELDLISVAAGPYALTRSLAEDDPEFSCIFVDVGAHTTDVIVVHQGGIAGLQSFSLGGHAFSHNLSKELKTSFDKADRIKIDYAMGWLEKKSEAKVGPILKTTAQTWAIGVAEALDEFHHLDVLPNRIFICGAAGQLPEIKNVLLTKNWAASLPFAKKPYPQLIDLPELPGVTVAEGVTLELTDLTGLGLVYLTLETDLKDDAVGDMLQRIVLSMQS